MKIAMWLIVSILLVGFIWVFYSFRFKDIETPSYKLVKTIEDVEIRVYPKMILAQTALKGKRYESNGNNGFRTVAAYIFGGNQNQQKIAMTAPVIMSMSDSNASMSFVMPSQYQLSDLPKPISQDVTLITQDIMTLAVLRFGGFASDEKINRYAKKLGLILQENHIRIRGPLLYMGYNAPWDLINRRSEVAFEIE